MENFWAESPRPRVAFPVSLNSHAPKMHLAHQLALVASVLLVTARAAQHPSENSLAHQLGPAPSIGAGNITVPNELALERYQPSFDRKRITSHGDRSRSMVDHCSHKQCDTMNMRLTRLPSFAGRTPSYMERPPLLAHANKLEVTCNSQLVVGNLTVGHHESHTLVTPPHGDSPSTLISRSLGIGSRQVLGSSNGVDGQLLHSSLTSGILSKKDRAHAYGVRTADKASSSAATQQENLHTAIPHTHDSHDTDHSDQVSSMGTCGWLEASASAISATASTAARRCIDMTRRASDVMVYYTLWRSHAQEHNPHGRFQRSSGQGTTLSNPYNHTLRNGRPPLLNPVTPVAAISNTEIIKTVSTAVCSLYPQPLPNATSHASRTGITNLIAQSPLLNPIIIATIPATTEIIKSTPTTAGKPPQQPLPSATLSTFRTGMHSTIAYSCNILRTASGNISTSLATAASTAASKLHQLARTVVTAAARATDTLPQILQVPTAIRLAHPTVFAPPLNTSNSSRQHSSRQQSSRQHSTR